MKNTNTFKFLVGALLLGTVFTACDKFEDDVPPARMSSLLLNDDTYNTVKNQGVQIDVLANDTIGGTATLSFGQPQAGTIQTGNNGAVFYQPDTNFTGTDTFTYTACLGNECESAMVVVTVKNDTTNNCVVKAFDDVKNIIQGKHDSVAVLLNDILCGEAPANTVISVSQPAHGLAFTTPYKNIVYAADTSYIGPDELTYTITNAKGTSTAKLRINVTSAPQNCHITARPDSGFTKPIPGTTLDSVSFKVVANDIICPNAGPVTVVPILGGMQYGTLNITNNAGVNTRIIYTTTPNAPSNFNTSFQYRICQGANCSTTTVYVRRR